MLCTSHTASSRTEPTAVEMSSYAWVHEACLFLYGTERHSWTQCTADNLGPISRTISSNYVAQGIVCSTPDSTDFCLAIIVIGLLINHSAQCSTHMCLPDGVALSATGALRHSSLIGMCCAVHVLQPPCPTPPTGRAQLQSGRA